MTHRVTFSPTEDTRWHWPSYRQVNEYGKLERILKWTSLQRHTYIWAEESPQQLNNNQRQLDQSYQPNPPRQVAWTWWERKGSKSECGNYRCKNLLLIAGTNLTRVLPNRLLWSLIYDTFPESQSGFRSNRGTSDMVFAARQIQEKCRKQNKELYSLVYQYHVTQPIIFLCLLKSVVSFMWFLANWTNDVGYLLLGYVWLFIYCLNEFFQVVNGIDIER